jgi:lysozyme family protein
MQYTSTKFNNYFKNVVLKWEGKTSNDSRDTAVRCAPFSGAIHTNKGVTFCTFKANAKRLKIEPVTYNKFISLTDEEIKRFVWDFMRSVQAEQFKDSVALALTEAAWGSGSVRAIRQLYEALNKLNYRLPVKDTLTQNVINIANNINEQLLFNEFIKIREKYLYETLGKNPRYSMFVRGWRNRMEDFKKKFAPKRNFFNFFFLGSALFFLAIPKK